MDSSSSEGFSSFPKSPPKVYRTIFGPIRTLSTINVEEWIFIAITALGVLSAIAFAIYFLASMTKADLDLIFAILILINSLFIAYYLVNGVLTERPYELLVLVVASAILLIYAIVNFSTNTSSRVKLARMIVAILLGLLIIILGLHISYGYHDSGNFIFNTIGALSTLVDYCKMRYFFYSLLKFDLQLSVSMVVLVMTTMKVDELDIVVFSLGSVFVISWFVIGHLAARWENRILTWIFFTGSPVYMAYVIYKIVQAGITSSHSLLEISTFVCGAVSMVVHLGLIVAMVLVYRNFGKGLKERTSNYTSVLGKGYGSTQQDATQHRDTDVVVQGSV